MSKAFLFFSHPMVVVKAMGMGFGACGLLLALLVVSAELQAQAGLPEFSPLVERLAPSVVNISGRSKPGDDKTPFDERIPEQWKEHPGYEFFKRFFPEWPSQPSPESNSLGSGFIISEDGHIITNHHVVQRADEIVVRLNDRREFIAELVGSDERSDLALLRIPATDLPALELGDSSGLRVGEWVLAIGSPFGFDYSVTAGIISAIGRSLPNENYVPFIQTDVAINRGNSGGPLFNLAGKVVGVNSQIYSHDGGFMGLSFAVPANLVRSVYQQLRDQGYVDRGWLGVMIQDVTRELAESFQMDVPRGALVTQVLEDSPAAAAGLRVGDIIVAYNGRKIRFSSELPPLVGLSNTGEKAALQVLRDGEEVSIRVRIESLPDDDRLALGSAGSRGGRTRGGNVLGIEVENLDNELRERYGLDKGDGVVISSISHQGTAWKSGLRSGDIILQINNEIVRNSRQFSSLLRDLPDDRAIPVLVQRQNGPLFLALNLSDE